jgi:hypothetical protein
MKHNVIAPLSQVRGDSLLTKNEKEPDDDEDDTDHEPRDTR